MKSLCSVLVAVLIAGTCRAADLTIGLIPEQNVFMQKSRYMPISEYVAKKTGIQLKFTILPRYGNIVETFREKKLDGAFFGSFTGALALERLETEPLARPVNLDGTSTYRGYIFVRKDSGIRTVGEMRGRRVAFVEKATTAGYVYPIGYFRQHGVSDVAKYFNDLYFAGSHDAAIHAVLDGKADVGCAKHSMFDRLARKDPRLKAELVVLAESPDVPSNGLLVRRSLDSEVKRRLREALLGMDKDSEGVEKLRLFEALKFIGLTRDDYAPVYDIAAKAGIDVKTYVYVNK